MLLTAWYRKAWLSRTVKSAIMPLSRFCNVCPVPASVPGRDQCQFRAEPDYRPRHAGPNVRKGLIFRFDCGLWNDRCRRTSLVAAHSSDRLLSEPTAGAQPRRRECVLMPQSRRPKHSGDQRGRGGIVLVLMQMAGGVADDHRPEDVYRQIARSGRGAAYFISSKSPGFQLPSKAGPSGPYRRK